jgi:hypothetical protein
VPAPEAPRGEVEPDYGLFIGRQLRGRWIYDERYQPLRNAAWAVRRSRVGGANNPVALQLVCAAAVTLREQGEQDFDIFEALAELLVHP